MLFLALGVCSALIYAVWVLWVPLLPSNLYVPLLDLGKITGYTTSSAALYLAMVVSLYLVYAAGYLLTRRGEAALRTMVALTAFFCFELLLAYPATAVDVFGYVAHGHLLVFRGANPFVVAPLAFPTDPILPYLAFPGEPSQYGPGWALVGGAIALLGQGNLLVEVLLYKLLAAMAHLGGGLVIYRIARCLTPDAAQARACAYLYLWNPMLLWEMVGNAHNDGLMMLFGLVGVWLLVAHRDVLVLPAVGAGALVKVPVALVAPVLFVSLWHRGRGRAIEGGLLALALAVVVYRPFWEGIETLTALRRTDLFTASLGSVVRLGLTPELGPARAASVASGVSLGGFVLVALLAVVLATRATSSQDALRLAYFTLTGALLLATTWFQAWYVVWPLAFGAALPEPRRHLEAALLSLGGLLQYVVFIYLWVMGVFPAGENFGVQTAAYVCIVGPLLIAVAVRAVPRTGYG